MKCRWCGKSIRILENWGNGESAYVNQEGSDPRRTTSFCKKAPVSTNPIGITNGGHWHEPSESYFVSKILENYEM